MSIYFTDDQFKEVVPTCTTWVEVANKLNVPHFMPTRRLHAGWNRDFKLKAYELNIDTSHMTGQSNSKKNQPRKRVPDSIVFSFGSGFRSAALKARLLKTGVPDICSMCGIGPEWEGKKITIQVDHIDGVHMNNVKSNLRLLCPNCHATTKHWSKKAPETNHLPPKITARLDI